MGSIFIDLECHGDPIVMEVTEDKEILMHGYDFDAEAALVELGFDSSPCFSIMLPFRETESAAPLDEAMIYFATNGYPEATEKMIEAGADVHADNNYAIRWATEGGWTEIVEILLNAGADPHTNENETLRTAVNHLDDEMVDLFKKHVPRHLQPRWLQEYPLFSF